MPLASPRLTAPVVLALLVAFGPEPCAAQTDATPDPPRSVIARVSVVSATAASGLLLGFGLGARDGVANDINHAAVNHGYGSREALQLNGTWHDLGWVLKPALVVNFAGAIAIGHVVEPSLGEGLLLAASWGASVGLGFHFGHNWQQGQAWNYFGSIDRSDRFANEVGPTLVVVSSIAVGAALYYITYRALR